jgi:primase-polymerase (primpol)-like protein
MYHKKHQNRPPSKDQFHGIIEKLHPFIGVDLDKCRDRETGILSAWAQSVVNELDSYTEVSPSGTGVKCILESGTSVASRRRSSPDIEVYSSDRFFTITGNVFGTKVKLNDRTEQLLGLHARLFPELASPSSPVPALNEETERASDGEVLQRASNARNGRKFCRLWKGDVSLHGNNHSEADLALCRILAFWCGPVGRQIDRLFRRSALWRVKWDKPHFSDRATYGQRTIHRAIAAQDGQFYRWPTGTRRKMEMLVA